MNKKEQIKKHFIPGKRLELKWRIENNNFLFRLTGPRTENIGNKKSFKKFENPFSR